MVSSLGGSPVADYQVASSMQAKLMAQFQKTPDYKQAVSYYQANIGKVTSVDGLLKNYRLLKTALGAFNLGGAINQTGLLRKLLSEDPNVRGSTAQRMVDPRFMAFAQAFWSLSRDGGASTSNPINVDSVIARFTNFQYQIWVSQTSQDPALRQALYAQNVIQDAVNVTNVGNLFAQFKNSFDAQQAVNYYNSNIGNITTVDQFVADQKLVNFALTAFGIDPATVSTNTVRQLVTQNPTDPASVAQNNPAYQKFATAFSTLSRDGGQTVQNRDSVAAIIANYQTFAFENLVAAGDSATLNRVFGTAGANQIATLRQSFNTESGATQASNYYRANIGNVGSGKDIAKDQGLLNVALLAYNIDPSKLSPTGIAAANNYYKTNIGNIKTVSQFTADQQLVNYALTAFAIDPSTVNTVSLNRLLTENPTSANSLAQTNPQYFAFAQAFQSLNGLGGVWIHGKNSIDSVVGAYQANALQTTVTTKLVQQQASGILQASNYYRANIGQVATPGQLLADQQLLNVALTAYGIDPNSVSSTQVNQLLTQNPIAAGSLAQTNPNYLSFALAFRSLNGSGGAGVHPADAVDSVLINYQKNELALVSTTTPNTLQANTIAQNINYYINNIGTITTPVALEADQTLVSVALTAYGIDPKSISLLQVNQLLTQNPTAAGSLAQTNSNYLAFAQAFQTLNTSGGSGIRTPTAINTVVKQYEAAALGPQTPINNASAYYQTNIAGVTNVSRFLADSNLVNIALTAYGINPATLTASQVQTLVTQNPATPGSLAQTNSNYTAFAQAFYSLNTDGGAAIHAQANINTVLVNYQNASLQAASGTAAGSAPPPAPLMSLFTQFQASSATQSAIAYYKANIGSVTSVAQLTANSTLLNFALTAYGVDPTKVSSTDVQNLLTQDPTSPASLALKNPNYLAFAQAFSTLKTDGGATIRSAAGINSVVAAYQNTGFMAALTTNSSPANAQFFDMTGINQIGMLRDDLLATKPTDLLVTQNPNNPMSLAQQSPQFTAFAQAVDTSSFGALFNLRNPGTIDKLLTNFQNNQFRAFIGSDLAQSQAANRAVNNNSATGTKTAPPLTVGQVLADPTLASVVRNAYGLPQSMAGLNVAQQSQALTRAGFDPAKLTQPGAVDKLVKQFLAMTTLQQSDSGGGGGNSQVAALFADADSDSGVIQVDLSPLLASNRNSDSTGSGLTKLNLLI